MIVGLLNGPYFIIDKPYAEIIRSMLEAKMLERCPQVITSSLCLLYAYIRSVRTCSNIAPPDIASTYIPIRVGLRLKACFDIRLGTVNRPTLRFQFHFVCALAIELPIRVCWRNGQNEGRYRRVYRLRFMARKEGYPLQSSLVGSRYSPFYGGDSQRVLAVCLISYMVIEIHILVGTCFCIIAGT